MDHGIPHLPARFQRLLGGLGCVGAAYLLTRQQRFHELKAIQWPQIADRFAGADEADRQAGFRGHRQGHAAAGTAIELG
jgi:hypothetical protein